ncbi:MAG: ca2+ sensor protein [Sphingomonadales bacterium]|nr:MAG: ca2+ sensor protein [Sphingomonadales bacterium]
MKKITIAALLGATLLATGAIAAVQDSKPSQDAPKHRMMRDPLGMADTNKDGVVTREEVTASVADRFAKLDANKDGKITVEERRAARMAMREAMGKRMRGGPDGPGRPGMRHGPDTNGDGAITLEEQRAQALKRFDFVDRNGDGKIDQAERDLVREMLMEMGGRGHHGRHGPHHGGGDMPPPPPPPAK